MDLSEIDLINEVFFAETVSRRQFDYLLAEGWRHFGKRFFRYNVGIYREELRFVKPLRIRLADFKLSRSQKRVIRRNRELETIVRPVQFDDDKHALFEKHAGRFDHGKPENIYSFLDEKASKVPCETLEFCVFDQKKLVAVSFLDIGEGAVSSIYAMFDPAFSNRSLGILTMLLEIEYALNTGKTLYYQGYAYKGESFYDYKKHFYATEFYDWKGEWRKL